MHSIHLMFLRFFESSLGASERSDNGAEWVTRRVGGWRVCYCKYHTRVVWEVKG